MKKYYSLIYSLTPSLLFSSFLSFYSPSSHSLLLQNPWFPASQYPQILFQNHSLSFSSQNQKLLLKALKLKNTPQNTLSYSISYVHPLLQHKYSINQTLHFSNPLFHKQQLFINFQSNHSHNPQKYQIPLAKKLKLLNLSYASLLLPFEIKSFLNDHSFQNARKSFLLLPSLPLLKTNTTLLKKLPLLIDGNIHSSFQIPLQNSNPSQLTFEFFALSKNGSKLQKSIPLRAIGFVTQSNNFKDSNTFNRLKLVNIQFSQNYNQGLGLFHALYSHHSFQILLQDRPKIQIVFFYKTIFFKGLKIHVQQIYPGTQNILKIYEIIFFTLA